MEGWKERYKGVELDGRCEGPCYFARLIDRRAALESRVKGLIWEGGIV